MKLVSVEEMRRIEQATDQAGNSYAAMMDMAGQGVASVADRLILEDPEQRVVVLVGPGNNGGDGLVAARYLREQGHEIILYIWKRATRGDDNFKLLRRRRRGVSILWAENDPGSEKLREELGRCDLVIDALLGTGVARPIEGDLAGMLGVVRATLDERRGQQVEEDNLTPLGVPRFPVLEAYAASVRQPWPSLPEVLGYENLRGDDADDGVLAEDESGDEDNADWEEEWEDDEELPEIPWPHPAVLAVDCPSGLDCDTGALDPAAVPADITVTFAFPKRGQFQFPGAGACGVLGVVDIGVPSRVAESLDVEVTGPARISDWLPKRRPDAHKGTFGKAMLVAGSLSYTGAALLSALAAARCGSGLVTLAIPAALHAALAGALPDITWLPLSTGGFHGPEGLRELLEALPLYDALLVGPGLTTREQARAFIEALFSGEGLPAAKWAGRTVVDADALNIMAATIGGDWPGRLPPGSVLTPHPGEMGRLIGETPAVVNARRIETARHWAAEWGHVVLLKGPHTVIAAPDGRTEVLPFAIASLATAGSGDVMAGAVVAMLAQGLPAFESAVCGAYLHGHAGMIAAREIGLAGPLARDIADYLPAALRGLSRGALRPYGA